MDEELEDPEVAANRLEAALERVARIAAAFPIRSLQAVPDLLEADPCVPDVADRLDMLIGRLQAALSVNNRVLKS